MANSRIVIGATPRKPIPVELVGKEYLVKPPKSTIAIALADRVKNAGDDVTALMAELNGWVEIAFGPKQAKLVAARLQDPADDLDIEHIIEVMTKLAEVGTANPSS